MPRIKHSMEQIIAKLRKSEIMLAEGSTLDEVLKSLGVTKQTFYRWKKEYGSLQMDKAKKLKELERENERLKRLVADLSLDNAILKEVNKGNF